MFKKHAIRVASVGVIAAALVGASAFAAHAAVDPTVGSTAPVYLVDNNTGEQIPADTSLEFDFSVSAIPNPDDLEERWIGPADTTSVRTFIAPRGSERTPSAWLAFEQGGFEPGTQNVWFATINPSSLGGGDIGAVKAAGGNYSLGFAFMNNNDLSIASDAVYYTYITMTAGTGAYTFDAPTDVVPPQPTSGAFDVNLNATTINAADGSLNLVAPASNTVNFGAATLVNNLSTSTASLGQFSVEDGRVVTHPGWTLTSTVTPFTNSADGSITIDAKQLGLKPKLDEANAGVTLADEQVAGSAVYPSLFAQTSNTAAVATTKFSADLTFVAPADKPAGTYTSKLTLTLASK